MGPHTAFGFRRNPTTLRPRYSVRTLVIVVTLVCVYFGMWEATKRWGVEAVTDHLVQVGRWSYWNADSTFAASSVPFIVSVNEFHPANSWVDENQQVSRHHYIWVFGWVFETPVRWAVETRLSVE